MTYCLLHSLKPLPTKTPPPPSFPELPPENSKKRNPSTIRDYISRYFNYQAYINPQFKPHFDQGLEDGMFPVGEVKEYTKKHRLNIFQQIPVNEDNFDFFGTWQPDSPIDDYYIKTIIWKFTDKYLTFRSYDETMNDNLFYPYIVKLRGEKQLAPLKEDKNPTQIHLIDFTRTNASLSLKSFSFEIRISKVQSVSFEPINLKVKVIFDKSWIFLKPTYQPQIRPIYYGYVSTYGRQRTAERKIPQFDLSFSYYDGFPLSPLDEFSTSLFDQISIFSIVDDYNQLGEMGKDLNRMYFHSYFHDHHLFFDPVNGIYKNLLAQLKKIVYMQNLFHFDKVTEKDISYTTPIKFTFFGLSIPKSKDKTAEAYYRIVDFVNDPHPKSHFTWDNSTLSYPWKSCVKVNPNYDENDIDYKSPKSPYGKEDGWILPPDDYNLSNCDMHE